MSPARRLGRPGRWLILALALGLLSGCASALKVASIGSEGSLERRTRGETTYEANSVGGYVMESVQGRDQYRLTDGTLFSWSHTAEAREFQTQIGRLADEITESLGQGGLSGRQMAILATTFVNLDDLNRTSTFGRLCAEQLAGELKRREFEVVEARRSLDLQLLPKTGELSLSRDPAELAASFKANALLVGTYAVTAQHVVLNVRLIKAQDNTLAAVGAAVFERQGNLFVNSLLLKEAQAERPASRHPRVKLAVSDQFFQGRLKEEDLAPEPPAKKAAKP